MVRCMQASVWQFLLPLWLAVGGWQLVVVGSGWLAVGGWWLVAVTMGDRVTGLRQ